MNDTLKQQAAQAALQLIKEEMIIGVGSGSTVHYFIEALGSIRHKIEACVASSAETAARLKAQHIPVFELNATGDLPLYIDSADEVMSSGEMIKGGGGALTREKIIASASKQFVCIVDESKMVRRLGVFPVAVEVLPMARSFVARQLVKLGGDPVYREGYTTDNGNIILDVHHLEILQPMHLEEAITLIPGVVTCGIFASRSADQIIVADHNGVKTMDAAK